MGARRSDILLQFLLESMMLSLSGGLVGAAIGLLLGTVPARKASLAKPVESLRAQ